MKTKLLRKIRKEYEILFYPNGSKAVDDLFWKNVPHYRPRFKMKVLGNWYFYELGKVAGRKDAYSLVIKSIRERYKSNEKGKFKRLW